MKIRSNSLRGAVDAADGAGLLLDLILDFVAEHFEARDRYEGDDADEDDVLDHVGALHVSDYFLHGSKYLVSEQDIFKSRFCLPTKGPLSLRRI